MNKNDGLPPIDLMNAQEMARELAEQKKTGGRAKIYKAQADEHRQTQLSEDIHRKVTALKAETQRQRVNLHDLPEVQGRVIEYLTACEKAGAIPTVSTLAVFGLGLSRRRLNKYMSDYPDDPSTLFLEQVKDLIADLLETGSLSNSLNAIMSIFILKNDHGRADRVELEPVPPKADYATQTREELMEKYGDFTAAIEGSTSGEIADDET